MSNSASLKDQNHLAPFSCDLVTNSFLHRNFLETIHELRVSHLSSPNESLRRYRDLWLPLVHKYPGKKLIPPPDIAWLWHCHRLAPKDYINYVTKRFATNLILEACPPFAVQTPDVLKYNETATAPSLATRRLWKQTYGEHEPFFLLGQKESTTKTISKQKDLSVGGFDLLGSTHRQATFLWQISGERFDDQEFLDEGRDNYLKFLRLRKKAWEQRVMLVPTFQIDLMWHTHMLTSLTKYNEDCIVIMGSTFHHDDSHSDRSPGGVLDNSYHQTMQLWKKEYGQDYAVPGGMYRGEPPSAFFASSSRFASRDLPASPPLIEMGASSTSPPSGPKTWADVNGTTSDGSPAFVKASGNLKLLPKQENYILGRTAAHGVGYFHLETREANEIIATRMAVYCKRLESHIAMQQCCCGTVQSINELEKQLANAKALHKEMQARCKAKRPMGTVATTTTTSRGLSSSNDFDPHNNNNNALLYASTGAWLYPPVIWDNCGGACGGAVYCSPSACGGTSLAGACGGGGSGCGGGGGGAGCGGASGGGGCGGTTSAGGGCGGGT